VNAPKYDSFNSTRNPIIGTAGSSAQSLIVRPAIRNVEYNTSRSMPNRIT
jgi:hypothetical protein